MQWSKNQKECIETFGQPTIVSASAGAGKTAVLTQRIVKRCLDDHIDMNHIMALTFTNAAANEMKQRVHNKLNEQLDNPAYDRQIVEKQLSLLDEAKISTIHSFCLDILKKYSYTIGFDTARIDHKIIGSEATLLMNKAFDLTLGEFNQHDLFELLQYFSTRMEDTTALQQACTNLMKEALKTANPIQWLNDLTNNYPLNIQSIEQLPVHILEQYHYILDYNCAMTLQLIDELIKKGHPDYLDDKKMALLKKHVDAINKLVAYNNTKDYAMIQEALSYYFNATLGVSSKKEEFKFSQEYAKSINENISDLVNQFMPSLVVKHNNMAAPIIPRLSQFTINFINHFNQLKEEINGIDFNDMELLTYQILNENPDICQAYRNFFQEVCVDEFQDTSIRQNDIINMVAKQNVIFRVGDVKQSIYRFRGGKPSLMMDLLNDPKQKVIVLDENYRSSASIIDFTNELFSRSFNIDASNNSYSKLDIVKPGTQQQRDSYIPVEFYGIDYKTFKLDDNNDEKENGLIAKYIAKVIQDGVKNNIDGFNHYSDYCVLVKSHAAMNYLQRQFDAYGIPYYMDLKSGFSKSKAVRLIKALLTFILNSDSDISIATILTSHIFSEDVQSLYQLKGTYSNISEAIKQTDHPLYQQRKQWISIYNTKGLHELITVLYSYKDLYLYADKNDRFNLDYLLELIINNETITTIEQVLIQLDEHIDSDSSEIRSISKDEDIVKVMTIHQSKGLQFNVVILYSNGSIRDNDAKSGLSIHEKYGLGIRAKNYPYHDKYKTIQETIINHHNTIDDLDEQQRVLYVALTRPKYKLVVVDSLKNHDYSFGFTSNDFLSRKGYSDTIIKSIDNVKLMHFIKVVQPFTTQVNPIEKITQVEFKKYELPVATIKMDSASKNLHIASQNLYKTNQNSDYGTKIHETLAVLDEETITMQSLQTYDQSLSKPQIKAIIKFKDNILQFKKENAIQEVYKELPFIVQQDNSIYSGSIDYLAINESTVFIIDYKTTNASKQELVAIYQSQLLFYKKAITSSFPNHQFKALIYSFHFNEFINVPLSE